MGQARKKYTREYRDEAVDLVVKSGRPIAEIARDLGINEATLGNWVLRAKQAGKVPEMPEEPLGAGERAELKELREEVRRLRMEREFLKKAAAWFARESQ